MEYEYGYEYSISKKGPHPFPSLTQPASERARGGSIWSPTGDVQNSHWLVGLFLYDTADFGRAMMMCACDDIPKKNTSRETESLGLHAGRKWEELLHKREKRTCRFGRLRWTMLFRVSGAASTRTVRTFSGGAVAGE